MRLPLPATTEGVRINLRAGEIPGQRQLPREGNRVIKGFQDGANLNVFQTRLERGAGNVFTYVQRARQGEISCPIFPLSSEMTSRPLWLNIWLLTSVKSIPRQRTLFAFSRMSAVNPRRPL